VTAYSYDRTACPPTRIGSATELTKGDEVTFIRNVKTKWGLTIPKGSKGVVKAVGRLISVVPKSIPEWEPGEAITWPNQEAALRDVRP